MLCCTFYLLQSYACNGDDLASYPCIVSYPAHSRKVLISSAQVFELVTLHYKCMVWLYTCENLIYIQKGIKVSNSFPLQVL